jgi:hypothetical protein
VSLATGFLEPAIDDAQGHMAEEWVETDSRILLEKLTNEATER